MYLFVDIMRTGACTCMYVRGYVHGHLPRLMQIGLFTRLYAYAT